MFKARRTAGVIAGIEGVAATVDPLLPIGAVRTFDDLRSKSLAWERFQALLLTSLAALALVLAVTGIYGLMSQSVQERRRELGVRLALGASLPRVLGAAVLPGLVMALAGVAVGSVAASGMSRVLGHLLWGVTAADPLTVRRGRCRTAARRRHRGAGTGAVDHAAGSGGDAAGGVRK